MVTFETTFPVRYYETDQMGIVHHSNFIRYFECARNVMLCELGYPIEQCEKDGVTFPVVKVECNYKYPAKMGDVLTVSASIERVPMAKFLIYQKIVNQDGKTCADGYVTLGFLSKETGRPTRCPETLAHLFEQRLNNY